MGGLGARWGIIAEIINGRGWANHRRYRVSSAKCSRGCCRPFRSGGGLQPHVGAGRPVAADPCFIERAHAQRGWLYRLTGRYRFFAECEKAVLSPRAACEILLLSLNEKIVFQRWYATPETRFHLLPPYISAQRFAFGDRDAMRADVRTEFGFGTDDLLLLLVGSGFSTKGLDRAIQALAALPQDLRVRTRLLAVGQDNPRFFRNMAERLGIGAQVYVIAGRDDVPRLMHAADLLVHPAYRENTGLVLLEAMASGLPVLASDVCGYAFHVIKSGAGELAVSPFDQATFNNRWRTC